MAISCNQALALYIYYKMELHIVNFSLILKWNVDRLKELSVSCAIFQIGHVAVHLFTISCVIPFEIFQVSPTFAMCNINMMR
jgi:hypothetical protein